MLITEQLYNKFDKIYYHGQTYKETDKTIKEFSCYYLTTNPYYAFRYATQKGYIIAYRFKKGTNLCNLKSKKDRKIVRNYFRELHIDISVDTLNTLSEEDWLTFFKSTKNREIFLETLKELNYDGFFNFRIEDKLNGQFRRTNSTLGFPSIGVFDETSLEKLHIYRGIDEFLKISEIKKVFDNEIKNFKDELYKLFKRDNKLIPTEVNNLIKKLEKEEYLDLLQDNDTLYVLNNFDAKEIEKERKIEEERIREVLVGHLRDWWGFEPTNEDLKRYGFDFLIKN